jgi:hypothetical protein
MAFVKHWFLPTGRSHNKNDPRTTAFHEAAHAVMGVLFGIKIKYVTNVRSRGITYGHVWWWRRDAKIGQRYKNIALLAAPWGEVLAEKGDGKWPKVLGVLLCDVPEGPDPFKYFGWARDFVWTYRREITRVAEALMVRRRMTGYEVAVVAFGQCRHRTR